MGYHFEREYWHYSHPSTATPFTFKIVHEVDNRAGFESSLTAIMYDDRLMTRTRALVIDQRKTETLSRFVTRIGKEAAQRGAPLTDMEYERLLNFILTDICGDTRRPKKGELIND